MKEINHTQQTITFSKATKKNARNGVFVVNFAHISHLFTFGALNMYLFAGLHHCSQYINHKEIVKAKQLTYM